MIFGGALRIGARRSFSGDDMNAAFVLEQACITGRGVGRLAAGLLFGFLLLAATLMPDRALAHAALIKTDPGDGRFDLIATRARGRLAWWRAALMGSLHLYDRVPDVVRVHATEATLASSTRVPIQLDGEPCGTLPVSVRLKPSAIRLLSLPEGKR